MSFSSQIRHRYVLVRKEDANTQPSTLTTLTPVSHLLLAGATAVFLQLGVMSLFLGEKKNKKEWSVDQIKDTWKKHIAPSAKQLSSIHMHDLIPSSIIWIPVSLISICEIRRSRYCSPSLFMLLGTFVAWKLSTDVFFSSSRGRNTRNGNGSGNHKSKLLAVTTDKNRSVIDADGDHSLLMPPPALTHHRSRVASAVPRSTKNPERYLELMVHNVSHTDMIFSFNSGDFPEKAGKNPSMPGSAGLQVEVPFSLCRPRFSCFDVYFRKVLRIFQKHNNDLKLITAPRYQRSLDDARLSIQAVPRDQLPTTPIGFKIPTPVPVNDWHDLRVRGCDQVKVDNGATGTLGQIFFPLISTLLPRWQERIDDRNYPPGTPVHRVLLLVTGVGSPRNWTHSIMGNSTAVATDLVKIFLRYVDPNVTVVGVHSTTNLFRYDENLLFIERELTPVIEAYRDAHARGLPYPQDLQEVVARDTNLSAPHRNDSQHPFNEDWQQSFTVTLSFADGSPARTHAIQACLRPYRPTYFHFWQLKTFWHEGKIVDDDIEVHAFETMDATSPPIDVSQCMDEWIILIHDKMKEFLAETMRTINNRDRFWLRKTQKGVLSVLLVQTPEMENPVFFRGTNMEVSMPTGSLCAERNAIGSALAQNPALKREDLKMIAVLAIPPVPRQASASQKALSTLQHVSSTSTLDTDQSRASIGADVEALGSNSSHRVSPSATASTSRRSAPIRSETEDWVIPSAHPSKEDASQSDKTATPVRRIPLFSSSQVRKRASSTMKWKNFPASQQKQLPTTNNSASNLPVQAPPSIQRTVVVHSYEDLNPLPPCGTCNEWLKKIAEANPYFRIVTFTDANCNGIYCRPCRE